MRELTKLFEDADIDELCREAMAGGIEATMALTNAGVIYSKVQVASMKARLWLSIPDDPRHDDARQILVHAEKLKALAARDLPVYGTAEKITRICETAESKITWPLVEHGKAFRDGPKNPRVDAMGRLILAALNELGARAAAADVLAHVEQHGAGVIDEVDAETIYWRAHNGREKATSIARFQNRVSAYRKKLSD